MTHAAHFITTCETMDAPQLACLFLDHIFHHHGFPQAIISNRGSVFISSFFTNLMKICGVKMKPSTAYHPQTDGLTEQMTQTLETYLRTFCSYQQDDWVDYLALAEFSFNNSINSSTQQTPFFANLGYHPNFNITIIDQTTNPSATDLATRLDIIHSELRTELSHSNDYMAKQYNKHHLPQPSFQIGDLVWLLRQNIKTTQPSEKLDFHRLGPFKILDQCGKSSFLLKLPSTLSHLHPVFHVSLLEPFVDPSIIPNRLTDSSSPLDPQLFPESPIPISAIIDSQKVGHHYSYFVSWKFSTDSENSWLPLSEIPSNLYYILKQFHHQNPSQLHPPHFQFSNSFTTSPTSFDTIPLIQTTIPYQPICSPSPPPQPYLCDYQPPAHQLTRSGRLVRPPPSKEYATSTLKKGVV